MLVVRPVPPALAAFVETLWHWEGDHPPGLERILPTGAMQLIVNLHEDELRTYEGDGFAIVRRTRGATVGGVRDRVFAIDTDEQRAVIGVEFRAGGGFPFFAPPPGALAGVDVELGDVWGRDGEVLRERLLEARTADARLAIVETALLTRAMRPLAIDPIVAGAVVALERGATVAAVVERVGLSPRHFARRFATQVGVTPKRFARLRRFQRVLAAVEAGRVLDWARVAVELGYFDQAHLIHDFREFSGLSPTGYRPRPGGRNHVPL